MPRPVSTGIKQVRRVAADGTVSHDWYCAKTKILLGRERDGMSREAAIAAARREREALAAPAGPRQGSFGDLCRLYITSPAFKKLSPRTKEGYLAHIAFLRGPCGWEHLPAVGITRTVVRSLHAGFEDRPWAGNALLRTLRIVFNFAIFELEWAGIARNPVERPQLYETRPRDQIWWQHHVDIFLEAASALGEERMRRAIALLLYTVQRPRDVLTMDAPMVWVGEDGRTWIRLRQAKTGEPVDVPCHQVLAAELARQMPAPKPRRQRKDGKGDVTPAAELLLPSPTGLRWRYRNFARRWDQVRRRANLIVARRELRARGGLPSREDVKARAAAKASVRALMLGELQRRDLRRTGIVMLAIAGATTAQIAALSGHAIDEVQKILETYLPRRGEVAVGGIEKWEKAGPGKVVVLATRKSG